MLGEWWRYDDVGEVETRGSGRMMIVDNGEDNGKGSNANIF